MRTSLVRIEYKFHFIFFPYVTERLKVDYKTLKTVPNNKVSFYNETNSSIGGVFHESSHRFDECSGIEHSMLVGDYLYITHLLVLIPLPYSVRKSREFEQWIARMKRKPPDPDGRAGSTPAIRDDDDTERPQDLIFPWDRSVFDSIGIPPIPAPTGWIRPDTVEYPDPSDPLPVFSGGTLDSDVPDNDTRPGTLPWKDEVPLSSGSLPAHAVLSV